MKPITLRLSLEFDTASFSDPSPWWAPYWRFELTRNRFILRVALFGVHLLIAGHFYDE